VLNQIGYVQEKLRQLEFGRVNDDPNTQERMELRAKLARFRCPFGWTGYRLFATPFVHAARIGLHHLWRLPAGGREGLRARDTAN
jgi:hypothetical protein